MFLAPEDLSRFFSMLDERARKSEQVLNAADAKIGDGDTGSMLCRVLSAIASAQLAQAEQLSGAAILAAQAAMKETGSSLGTLVATGAMAFAKEAKKRGDKVRPDDLASVITSIRDAVSDRGKAVPGDKTIVDSLDAVATALADGPTDLETAKQGAVRALRAFRDRPCQIGRARMFPERSTGTDDPGMLAAALLLGDAAQNETSPVMIMENQR